MKTYRLTALAVLAVLFVGCGKDGDGRLRIYAEKMNNGGDKVWLDPSNVDSTSSWVIGEHIDLNGTPYAIADDGDGCYLNTGTIDLPPTLYAIYPASVTSGGNYVTVTNNSSSASTVLIRKLAVNFRDSNSVAGHDIILPMAASATRGEGKLLFNHLTGAMRFTLSDTSSANDYVVGSVKVVVYGDGAVPTSHSANNVTTSWEVQGPVMPSGEIGHIGGDQAVGYACEMNFALMTGGSVGKAIPTGGSIRFVLPVTVTPVKRLVVTGYSIDGAQLFVRSKDLVNALPVAVNNLYNIPAIEI